MKSKNAPAEKLSTQPTILQIYPVYVISFPKFKFSSDLRPDQREKNERKNLSDSKK